MIGYQETFVQLNVSGGDLNDWHVKMMVEHRINVMVPIRDVLETIKEKEG